MENSNSNNSESIYNKIIDKIKHYFIDYKIIIKDDDTEYVKIKKNLLKI